MTRYAANTSVTPDRSRAEIERTLTRYGAGAFMYGWEGTNAVIAFKAHERLIRFILPVPDRDDFYLTAGGQQRYSEAAVDKAHDQAIRQRWRALTLAIKAKLEAVESGIVSFEDEFAAHIVLPDGTRVGDWLGPQIKRAYDTGKMPTVLPQLEAGPT